MRTEQIAYIISKTTNPEVAFRDNFNLEVIETISAFANLKGGTVYIGINETGNFNNDFRVNDQEIEIIIDKIKKKTQPAVDINVEIIEVQNNKILEINVLESTIKPVSCKGIYLKRINNSNQNFTLHEIATAYLNNFNNSWDCYTTKNYSIKDIDEDKVTDFIKKANSGRKNKMKDEIPRILQKYELLKNEEVTNAAILLFPKNDISATTIEMISFVDNENISSRHTIRGSILMQADEVIDFIKKNIYKEHISDSTKKIKERWQYPIKAIREIVLNMIVHRDYTYNGNSIIKIYNDKIEFFNHGRLSEDITIANIQSGEYIPIIRNLKIAEIFKEAKLIEKYGAGFTRIFKYFKEYDLQLPVITNMQAGFKVVIYAKDKSRILKQEKNTANHLKLKEREKMMLQMIENNKEITQEEIAQEFNVSVETIKRDIKKLQKNNVIQRIGGRKTGQWLIVE